MQDHVERLHIRKRWVAVFLAGLFCLATVLLVRATRPITPSSNKRTIDELARERRRLAESCSAEAAAAVRKEANEVQSAALASGRFDEWKTAANAAGWLVQESSPIDGTFTLSRRVVVSRNNVGEREWPAIVAFFEGSFALPGTRVRSLLITSFPEKHLFSSVQFTLTVPTFKKNADYQN